MPTLAEADEVLDDAMATALRENDANDVLYQLSASWDYDPGPGAGADPRAALRRELRG